MIFDEVLVIHKINEDNIKVNYREAVRAIVIQDGKILMVHSNKGDYKFPGGGIQNKESHEEALRREVEEETGYALAEAKNKIGQVIERNHDRYERDSIFQMTSHYYLCSVSGIKTCQRLDDYEAELEFSPVFISLDDAIGENENVLKLKDKNHWVYRETFVLRQLRDHFSIL